MFNLLHKIEANITDARVLGPGFVARHLKPWADRHRFRYAGRPVTFRRRGGCDTQIIRYLLIDGEYRFLPAAEDVVRANYEKILKAGKTPVIVDAGGNIGMTAIWLAHAYPKATVVSIEPDPANFAILEENASHWPNVIPLRAALGGEPGRVDMSDGESWAIQTTRSDEGDTPIITIRQAAARAGDDAQLLIVKIDIEGFELDVFDGDTSWLDDIACLMIEPHDWLRPQEHTSRSFQREVGRRAFNLYIQQANLIYVRNA